MKARMVCLAALMVAGSAAAKAVGPRSMDASPPSAVAPPVPDNVRSAAPGPQVAIAHHLIDDAGAFDGYMRRAASIDGKFTSGAGVARAVEVGSVYEPGQLEEGAIAYAALVALQDPDFVESVQRAAADPRARQAFAAQLVEHPEAIFGAPAARRAATRISAVLGDMGVKLLGAGSAVRQAAYDIQGQGWSKDPIVSPEKRLARIKAESATRISLAPDDTAHLVSGLVAQRSSDGGGAPEADSATRVVTQGLALAALAVLGKAGDDQEETFAPLLIDAVEKECLNIAKLNEFQCLAVAGPHYEDMFCLGRHAMMDPGHCIATAAGLADDQLPATPDGRSVLVPIAVASADQPERRGALGPSRDNGVAMPVAQSAAPENYSPYTGPASR